MPTTPGSDPSTGSCDGGTDPDGPVGAHVSERWAAWRAAIDLDEYDRRWDRMAAEGQEVHGEAELIASLERTPVLDAGCGTGRLGIELARRGFEVVGVDLDADLIERARRKAPAVEWIVDDLASMQLGRRFGVIAMIGNVLLFTRPSDVPTVMAVLAGHLDADGLLVAGFSLEPSGLDVEAYDDLCQQNGLVLEQRWATWAGEPFSPSSRYHVSVHRQDSVHELRR